MNILLKVTFKVEEWSMTNSLMNSFHEDECSFCVHTFVCIGIAIGQVVSMVVVVLDSITPHGVLDRIQYIVHKTIRGMYVCVNKHCQRLLLTIYRLSVQLAIKRCYYIIG